VYLKTPNAPGQRAFLRCAASFFLEIRQYSCEKMSCATQKSLAAGHIMSFQIHPSFPTGEQAGACEFAVNSYKTNAVCRAEQRPAPAEITETIAQAKIFICQHADFGV